MLFAVKIIYVVIICLLGFLTVRVKFGNSKLKNQVFIMLSIGMLTFVTSAIGLLAPNEFLATLFYGLFSSSVTFALISVLQFVYAYTGSTVKLLYFKIFALILTTMELVNFLLNVKYHHIFEVRYPTLFDGDAAYRIGKGTIFYTLHVAWCYIIVLLAFMMLVRKIHKSPRLYSRRYSGLLIVFGIVLVLDAIGIYTDVFMGISPLFYAILAVAIYEYAIVFAPKSLAAGLLSETIRDSEAGTVIYDVDERFIYANDLAEVTFTNKLLGDYSLEQFGSAWLNGRDPESIADVTWTQDTDSTPSQHYEITYTRIYDSANKFIGFSFTLMDRTDSVNNYVSEKYKATHDELTGLLNRSGFYEQVRKVLTDDPDTPRVIVVSNILDFKLLNDLFGEDRGNKVLRRVGNVMSQRCIDNDSIPARLESDRFAMCMRKDRYSDDTFAELPQRVIQLEENHLYRVICHIGVYEITEPDLPISAMCDRAILAMNTLKHSYTNLIAHYDSALRDKVVKEQRIIGSLQESLRNGEFQIYIQPQIQSRDLMCKGGEALVRWMQPEGMVPPGEFIPLFERTGLITTLDKYVWELACEKLRQWKSMGLDDFYISVNISPRDFYYIDIYETFTGLVEKYRINPGNLHLEITETVIMNDVNKQVALLNSLRAYGFHVEMDDFGSGYSSLNMLKNISVDVLKIDMGFLGETQPAKVERSRQILKMIVSLSKDLKMHIVSEGVETQDEVDFLKSIGVDIFQGYFFAKPMPVGQFEEKYVPI